MRSSPIRRLIFMCAMLLALPVVGYAQEAVLNGTVTDATGGVLPGVTIRAVHEASGNTFEAVTDDRGAYRIPVRIGVYRIAAELSGFTTLNRTGIEVLVGQTVTLNLLMSPSALAETVTVTGEAPLLETTTSSLGGNIDPRQMSELPVQGRSWTALALLAPGNRTNAFGGEGGANDTPVQDRADVREFQVNVDGQQVSQELGIAGQPRYSRDSIAEFQFISNRFDATQGRSMGVQVNAITKSGTNSYAGSFGGYFRDDRFNSEDPVVKRVLPYSNQQISGSIGGPISQNRLHFFANYEYEREPLTSVWTTAWPTFNVSLSDTRSVNMGGGRLDYQLSPRMRLMGKGHAAKEIVPFGAGSANHPAEANRLERPNREALVQFTHVLSNRSLNEIKGGYASWEIEQTNLTQWARHPLASADITGGHPRIRFRGFNILGNSNAPRIRKQGMYMLRDDFTFSYTAKGRHDLKAGGEWLFRTEDSRNCNLCMGEIDARNGLPANIEALFPDPFNADTWNLAALSPITRRYNVGVGNFRQPIDQNKIGTWVQDDWQISSRLTLNLGVRYDLTTNAYANDYALPPFLEAGRSDDTNNVQPRFGAAYTLNDRTVLRGGVGLYYADVLSTDALWTITSVNVNRIAVENDGRPDFASNPFNGPLPTLEQASQRYCYVNTAAFNTWRARGFTGAAPCLLRDAQELPVLGHTDFSYSWQTSIGVARQVGTDMAIEVDYVTNQNRNEKILQNNANLSFNPATGVNYPYSDRGRLPFPEWGIVGLIPHTGRSNYHGLQTSFTKRLSNNWQGSATYTASGLWNADGLPISGIQQVTFPVAADLGSDYTLAVTDQRHRFVVNSIWQVGHGFQVSGIYFYGSGERYATSYTGDLRGLGVAGLTGDAETTSERLRQDGTIISRNNFVGKPIHRVDLRLQQRLPIFGRTGVDGILEVFNLFDRANYGNYTLDEASPVYRNPEQSRNLAYRERVLQLGFRATF